VTDQDDRPRLLVEDTLGRRDVTRKGFAARTAVDLPGDMV